MISTEPLAITPIGGNKRRLPNGWKLARFDETAINCDGRRVPVKEAERARRAGPYPYYGASGIIDDIDGYIFDGEYLLIAEDGANLLSRTTPIAFRARGKFWVNNHAHVVQTRDGIAQSYLEHYLNSIDLSGFVSGTAQPKLNQANLNKIPVPLAPIAVQHRIVAEIEKQFTRLDAGIAALRNVKAKLKRYRAAVLKAACEGRLIEASFASVPLEQLINGLGQGWSPKCDLTRDPLPDEWAIVTTTAVQPMKYVDNQGKPLASKFSPRPHLEIRAGDFLMTRKGPRWRAGVTCLVRSTRSKMMLCDTVYRFRCEEGRVLPSYLELALNSPRVVSEINKRKSGINESGVSLTHDKIGGVDIPLPSLDEQKRIVAEVERRLSVVEELEAVVSANLQRAARLRQSILQKAFSGDLT